MDLCFFLTRGSFGSSVETGTIGVKRRMEELLAKHMNDLRFVEAVYSVILNAFFCEKGPSLLH